MNYYNEIDAIYSHVAEARNLIKIAEEKLDVEGVDWFSAELVVLGEDEIKYFKNRNGETEDYFVTQWTGYAEDDYHGYLYFKTNYPNQYIKVYYEC